MCIRDREQTIRTGQAHYWSRSRQALWHKGATSGLIQQVRAIRVEDVYKRQDQLQQPRAEDPHHRQDRPQLDHHLEHLALAGLEVDPVADQDQVAGAGHRNEFRQPLDDAEDEGLDEIKRGVSHDGEVPWGNPGG